MGVVAVVVVLVCDADVGLEDEEDVRLPEFFSEDVDDDNLKKP